MKKPELTAQILGMYIGRRANIEFKNYYTATDSDVITPALVGYFVLGDVDITPHLRRLESITPKEVNELYELELTSLGNYIVKPVCIGSPSYWLYLLSRGFDLFGLIDAGIAEEVSE